MGTRFLCRTSIGRESKGLTVVEGRQEGEKEHEYNAEPQLGGSHL